MGTLDDQVQERTQHLSEANDQLNDALRRAVAADQAKGEFLANMSHEIRTPMTAILGYADLLRRSDKATSAADSDAIDTIICNGEHLLLLINDILDLSKIEAGKLDIEQVAVSPFEVATEATSLMKLKADENNVALELSFEDELPRSFATDPTRLRQILVNLIGNAIKFTKEGHIRVSVACPTPDEISFSISDTGIGISANALERLFRPFTQSDASTTRQFGGTGLGLSISQRLAELMQGSITCESELGKGSTFRVVLPVPTDCTTEMINHAIFMKERETITPPRPEVSESIEVGECRILLVEDVRTNQMLISLILEESIGADVSVRENGQLGVEAALEAMDAGQAYDVILMDMQMPVLDGYCAARKLREANYTGPIVALTAHAMAEDCQLCLDAGCDDYATKPIDREVLVSKVTHYCDKSTAAQ